MKEIVVKQITAEQVLPLRAQVLRPHHPLIDCVFESDHVALAGHFGAGYQVGEILSVGTIYPEAFPTAPEMDTEFWRLRGMATEETARGEGLGAKILHSCIKHVRANHRNDRTRPKTVIWAHARTGALKFYRRHGFRTVGSEYDLAEIGPHYLIVLDL
jgi:GNAT superfamily N-acetyltransferase